MKLTLQKRLASSVARVSPKKVSFDPASLADVKEAITKQDIRRLISEGVIAIGSDKGVSRGRANHIRKQKKKGLRKNLGSRKGTRTARTPGKRAWINRVRSQRKFLRRILEKNIVTKETYKNLYYRSAGGFFRTVKHIQIFMDEKDLVIKKPATTDAAPAAKAAPAKTKKQ